MKPERFRSVLATVILGGILLSPTAHAQYTGDFQTNIISGVGVDWTGTYAVGSNTSYDFLGVDSGGALISDAGAIGYNDQPDPSAGLVGNDSVLVSGGGSIWSNRNDLLIGYRAFSYNLNKTNSLTIADGGAVYDNNATIRGSYNTMVVIGTGSLWNNSGSLTVGITVSEGHHSLTIADGGVVSDDTGILGGLGNDTILVTGPGSVWSNRNTLSIDSEGENSLVISNGGVVYDLNGIVWGGGRQQGTDHGSWLGLEQPQ